MSRMFIEVNAEGLVPGTITVEDEEDAERVFEVLIDAQGIPGVCRFEKAILKQGNRVLWTRMFEDYY